MHIHFHYQHHIQKPPTYPSHEFYGPLSSQMVWYTHPCTFIPLKKITFSLWRLSMCFLLHLIVHNSIILDFQFLSLDANPVSLTTPPHPPVSHPVTIINNFPFSSYSVKDHHQLLDDLLPMAKSRMFWIGYKYGLHKKCTWHQGACQISLFPKGNLWAMDIGNDFCTDSDTNIGCQSSGVKGLDMIQNLIYLMRYIIIPDIEDNTWWKLPYTMC